jgi:hypothetical protein
MKNKIYKLMGVALVVMLLASLMVGLAAAPAGAAVTSKLKWAELTLPKVGEAGDFWTTPSTDVGPIAVAPDGDTLFAAVGGPGDATVHVYINTTISGEDMTITVTYLNQYAAEKTVTITIESGESGEWSEGLLPINEALVDVLDIEGSGAEEAEGVVYICGHSGGGQVFGTYTDTASDDYGDFTDGSAPSTYGFYLGSSWFDLLKSTDGGYTWVVTGFFEEWSDIEGYHAPASPIVDIVVSPDYADDTTVFVATQYTVYQSVDSGKNFNCMEDDPGDYWDADINDIDVALDGRGRLAIMLGTENDVWVFSTETGMNWQEQLIDGSSPWIDNVIAVAFSPTFSDDEGIYAVVSGYNSDTSTDETWMRCSFGNTADGGGWGADIGDAQFTNSEGESFWSWQARIAFPDDFDPFGVDNNVCFVGITTYFDPYDDFAPGADIDPTDGGDAYKVGFRDGAPSRTTDLDVRGVITTLLPTATEVTSIAVSGDADSATIIVGVDSANLTVAPESYLVYYSTDSGETWDPAAKGPTGGTDYNDWGDYPADSYYGMATPKVVMAPDFATSGIAYCSTWGLDTSAFQRSTDGGDSWNQISLIDYCWDGDYVVKDVDAAGYNAAGSVRITTAAYAEDTYYGAIFERTGGKHWERILSYANLGVTDNITELRIKGAYFAIDFTENYIWRSSDNGATWPKRITAKAGPLTEVMPISATTIYTGYGNGEVWWSTKSGVGWTKPDDSEIPPTTAIIDISVLGDVVLFGSTDGSEYISDDGGETIERVGLEGPFPGGPTLESFDLGFAANNIIYGTSPAIPAAGVWRTEVDLNDPHASDWVQIDDIDQPDEYNPGNFLAGGPLITLPPKGVGYVIDASAVVDPGKDTEDAAGGIWRSTEPTNDVDSIYPPYFERENKDLGLGDKLGMKDLDLAAPPSLSPTFFCVNAAADNYYEQVLMFTDTLNFGVPLTTPTNNEIGVGLVPVGKVHPEVSLVWQEMAGATSYQWQLALDSEFKSVVIPTADQFVSAMITEPLSLQPNTTYYWRVRVAKWGSIFGAPLISPWSDTFKFKTAIGAVSARPDLQAPWAGEEDVELVPTFEWSGIEWAVKYEYELATDPTTGTGGYFTTSLKALTGANALVSTAWKSDITLQYNTRYYWHVKAIGVDTETPWSDVGTFTTMSEPVPAPSPQPPVQIPPVKEITPAWIWAIVIIGAILVIAVIVLIVTTRRVP